MKLSYPVLLLSAVFALTISSLQAQPTSAGYALKFDGIADYVKVNHQAQFSFTNSFTVEAWIRVNNFAGASMSIANKGDTAWRFQVSSSGVLAFQTVGLSPATLTGTVFVGDGAWHHVAAVYDASGSAHTRLYVDGELDVSATVTGTLSQNSLSVCIAANAETTNRFFDGRIDEMRFWSIDRSTNQIPNNMRKLLVGNETNLLAYLRFDNGSGTKADDDTGNGNFGSLSNNPVWVVSTAPIGPPVLTTTAATLVTENSARLNGTIDPAGQASGVYFKYGPTTSYGSTTPILLVPSNATGGSYFAPIGSLPPGKLYHFQLEATNGTGTGIGSDVTFTTLVGLPDVSGVSASNATTNSITLNANVQPGGGITRLYFEYGLDRTYGSFSTTNAISAGNTVVSTNLVITGLLPATTYHFHAIVTNSAGSDEGVDKIFNTAAILPSIVQQSASATSRSVVLSANINPNGSPTVIYFQYGSNSTYGQFSATNDIGEDNVVATSQVTIGGLLPGNVYSYRVVASNVVGTAFGGNATFTTDTEVPSLTSLPAGNVTSTNVTFNADVVPNGAATVVYFNYGTNQSYGSVSAIKSVGTGNSSVSTNAVVSGLLPGMTYHFQAMASNSVGTTAGTNQTLTLPAQVPGAVTSGAVIQTDGANLTASANPNGATTLVYFRYGTTTNYTDVTSTMTLPAGNSSVSISNFVGGLIYGAVYHFQVVASNSVGQVLGNDLTFTAPVIAPDVTTMDATNLTVNSATLNMVLNPNGAATTVYFNFGTNVSYGSVSVSKVIPAGLTSVPTNITVTGLLPGKLYHFQAVAANSAGTVLGIDGQFSLSPVVPTLTNVTSLVANNGVRISAQVNPNGALTTVYYEYGLTTNYGIYDSSNIVASGNSGVPVSSSLITNLAFVQVYQYRVVASNSAGVTVGTQSFTAPPGLPVLTTLNATNLTGNSATLNSTVNPNGAATTVYFNYGTNVSYGLVSAATLTTASLTPVLKNINVTSLLPGRTYNFQAVAANSVGTALGSNLTFTLPSVAPTLTAVTALVVTNGVTLLAQVNPNGAATTVFYEYGATTNYGTAVSTNVFPFGNSFIADASSFISGLALGQVYQCRVTASNSAGITVVTNSFTAPAGLPAVTTLPATNITATNATLAAALNPNSGPTTVSFQYGANTNYGLISSSLVIPIGTNTSQTNIDVVGLLPGVVYHFRAIATNTGGTAQGQDLSFAALALAPLANAFPALLVSNTATLSASINPNGALTTVYFQYGLTTNYGSSSLTGTVPAGNSFVTNSQIEPDLVPGALYHFRVVAVNTVGITFGDDLTFNVAAPSVGSLSAAPQATTLAATLAGTNATLIAAVNPNSAPTTAYFQYGTSTNYGSLTAITNLAATNALISISNLLTGLQFGTVYNVRVVASNSSGVTFGSNVSFRADPIALSQQVTFLENANAVGRTILLSGLPAGITFSTTRQPRYGVITNLNTFNGSCIYQPYQTTNFYGTDDFDFVVLKAGLTSAVATVTITILPTNSRPTAHPQWLYVRTNTPTAITLFGDDDADAINYSSLSSAGSSAQYHYSPSTNALTFANQTSPTNGILSGTAPNLVYTPNANFQGIDGFTFQVNDGTTNSLSASVNIFVTNRVDAVRPFIGKAVFVQPFDTYAYSPPSGGYDANGGVDESTKIVSLGSDSLGHSFSLNFFAGLRTNLYVHNNGFFTFLKPLDAFYATKLPYLPSAGPILAPFFADVDTRSNLRTDEWPGPTGIATFTNVYVNGRSAFEVTWKNVYAYGFSPTNLNSFQIVLIDRSDVAIGDFDAEFNYDQIRWLKGSLSGTNNAFVGYDSGNGTNAYAFATSGTTNTLDTSAIGLVKTNLRSSVLGRYVLQFRAPAALPRTVQTIMNTATNIILAGRVSDFAPSNYTIVTAPLRGTLSGAAPNLTYTPTNNYVGLDSFTFALSDNINSSTSRVDIVVSTGPTATTLAASQITTTNAILNGVVAPGQAATLAYFEFGLSTNYGTFSTTNALTATTNALPVSGLATSLVTNSIYHYRIVASNYLGRSFGADATFTAFAPPSVVTLSASNITTASAVLNASVNPGAVGVYYFEYGKTNHAPFVSAPISISGTNVQAVSLTVSNLSANTIWYFHVVATNSVSISLGNELSFKTVPLPPSVATLQALNVTATNAVLNALVSPEVDTTVYFQFGVTTNYNRFSSTNLLTATNLAVSIGNLVSNLAPATPCHFRVVAWNSGGTNYGADLAFTNFAAPDIFGISVTNILSTSAGLTTVINPNGATSMVYFQYGLSTNYGSFSITNALSGTNISLAVSNSITNLAPATVYHTRAVAANSLGTNSSADLTFTNLAAAPSIASVSVTNILSMSAALNALVNPNGATSMVYFQYGLSTNYGSFSITNGLSATNVSFSITNVITNLAPATVYHARAVATNSFGTVSSADLTFTNLADAPSIVSVSVTNILSTSAALTAFVNPNGATSMVYFEYGLSTNYGIIAITNVLSATNVSLSISNLVTNLPPATVYHIRLTAANSVGTNQSGDQSFITTAAAPSVSTQGATNFGHTHVTLQGTVNPNGSNSSAFFQYGLSTNYGSASSTMLLPGTNVSLFVSSVVSGLSPGITYHYRLTAFNGQGTNSGADLNFILPALPTLTGAGGLDGAFGFQFDNLANQTYTIESSTNLVQWFDVTNLLSLTNGFLIFSDTESSNYVKRFYRLRTD
ncbi:MAG: LamG domain protein jellyroll fold domain protein [Verrucomicrobiales bacterium]|nr:LamG domain protein jellyroll fold domain protein [Verrucomicrobiales bacterium]